MSENEDATSAHKLTKSQLQQQAEALVGHQEALVGLEREASNGLLVEADRMIRSSALTIHCAEWVVCRVYKCLDRVAGESRGVRLEDCTAQMVALENALATHEDDLAVKWDNANKVLEGQLRSLEQQCESLAAGVSNSKKTSAEMLQLQAKQVKSKIECLGLRSHLHTHSLRIGNRVMSNQQHAINRALIQNWRAEQMAEEAAVRGAGHIELLEVSCQMHQTEIRGASVLLLRNTIGSWISQTVHQCVRQWRGAVRHTTATELVGASATESSDPAAHSSNNQQAALFAIRLMRNTMYYWTRHASGRAVVLWRQNADTDWVRQQLQQQSDQFNANLADAHSEVTAVSLQKDQLEVDYETQLDKARTDHVASIGKLGEEASTGLEQVNVPHCGIAGAECAAGGR